MQEKVVNVASNRDFLGVLYQWLWDIARTHAKDHPLWMKNVRIYLPNLRLVRGLRERIMIGALQHGHTLILPHIAALGDLDAAGEDEVGEDPVALPRESGVPPALHEIERVLILYRLIQKWLHARANRTREKQTSAVEAHHAFHLAKSLAKLMDELDIQDITANEIDTIIPENLAEHWQMSRDFLLIVKETFPKICKERGRISVKKRQMLCLRHLRENWEKNHPHTPVVIAGSTGSIPATADLMEVVTRLPKGLLVLPGIDRVMPEETWKSLPDDVSHPQHGLQGILARLSLERSEIPEWGKESSIPPSSSERETLLSSAMYPQGFFGKSQGDDAVVSRSRVWEGVDLYEAQHLGEEALVIACAMREALEVEGKTVALVSPDNDLVRTVIASMRRWGILIDSSLGISALKRGSGILLDLTMEMMACECSAEKTIGLLYHPYCKMERTRQEIATILQGINKFRRLANVHVKTLEGLVTQIKHHEHSSVISQALRKNIQSLLTELSSKIRPLLHPKRQIFSEKLQRFVRFIEYVDEEVWQTDEGKKLADTLLLLENYGRILRDKIDNASFVMVLRSFLQDITFHPTHIKRSRVTILSPMEARLQRFDRVILGGLNEGTWPRRIGNNPWLSRPMRRKLGLISDEIAVGLQAHDFTQSFGAKEVLMTRSIKRGEPCIAARWLSRLKVLMNKEGWHYDRTVFQHAINASTILLSAPMISPFRQPKICPPQKVFPTAISVTSLDLLRENPYVFYAEKILKLRVPSLQRDHDFYQERGVLLHRLCEFLTRQIEQNPHLNSHLTRETLRVKAREKIGEILTKSTELSAMLRKIWYQKWQTIADDYTEVLLALREETERIMVEVEGEITLKNGVVLKGRADRLDVLRGSGDVRIVDLKTGGLSSQKDIRTMKASQLALLALVAKRRGFANIEAEIAEVCLYALSHQTAKRKKKVVVPMTDFALSSGIQSTEDEQNRDPHMLMENFVLAEISPYVEGRKPYIAPKTDDRNLEAWRPFTRSAEWSENG